MEQDPGKSQNKGCGVKGEGREGDISAAIARAATAGSMPTVSRADPTKTSAGSLWLQDPTAC